MKFSLLILGLVAYAAAATVPIGKSPLSEGLESRQYYPSAPTYYYPPAPTYYYPPAPTYYYPPAPTPAQLLAAYQQLAATNLLAASNLLQYMTAVLAASSYGQAPPPSPYPAPAPVTNPASLTPAQILSAYTSLVATNPTAAGQLLGQMANVLTAAIPPAPAPTVAPVPTVAPITAAPTVAPITAVPTVAPITAVPTVAPITAAPTVAPITAVPITVAPAPVPTVAPAPVPTVAPVPAPSTALTPAQILAAYQQLAAANLSAATTLLNQMTAAKTAATYNAPLPAFPYPAPAPVTNPASVTPAQILAAYQQLLTTNLPAATQLLGQLANVLSAAAVGK